MLDQHTQIEAHLEVFNDDPRYRNEARGRTLAEGEDGASFVHWLFTRPVKPGCRAVGFKLMYHHAHMEASKTVWTYLASEPRLVVLHLHRANLLEVIVSHRLAERTGVWQAPPIWWPRRAGKVMLSPDDCLRYFDNVLEERKEALERFAAFKPMSISYEDLTTNRQLVLNRITEALGVHPFTPKTEIRKLERLPMRKRVSNYAALREAFSKTEYAHFFE